MISQEVLYVNETTRGNRGNLLADFNTFVEKSNIDFQKRFSDAQPTALAKRINKQSTSTIAEMERSAFHGEYVIRKELDDALRKFVEGVGATAGMLLTGRGGAGKSQALRGLSKNLLKGVSTKNPTRGIYFIRCDKFTVQPGTPSVLFAGLKQMLGIEDTSHISSALNLIEEIDSRQKKSCPTKFVLIFDGVNEATDSGAALFQELVGLVIQAASYSWLKIIISSRCQFLESYSGRLKSENKASSDSVFHKPDEGSKFHNADTPYVWEIGCLSASEKQSFYEQFASATEPTNFPSWDRVDQDIKEKLFVRPLYLKLWFDLWSKLRDSEIAHLTKSKDPVSTLFVTYLNSQLAAKPYLEALFLPLAEVMLVNGRPALEEGELLDANIKLETLDQLVDEGLFERTVSSDFKVRYQPFHDRLGEAFGERQLRECWDAEKANSSPNRNRVQNHANAWSLLPRSEFVIDSFGHFIGRLLNEKMYQDAAEALEIVDWQLPPKNSWFFNAGRIALSSDLRGKLRGNEKTNNTACKNHYQLSLAQIRLGEVMQAIETIEQARQWEAGRKIKIALHMYEHLCWKEKARQATKHDEKVRYKQEVERCLRDAESLSQKNKKFLLGNILGHKASWLRVDMANLNEAVQTEIDNLYEEAMRLNDSQAPKERDVRSLNWWRIEAAKFRISRDEYEKANCLLQLIKDQDGVGVLDSKVRVDFLLTCVDLELKRDGELSADGENMLIEACELAKEIGDYASEQSARRRLEGSGEF